MYVFRKSLSIPATVFAVAVFTLLSVAGFNNPPWELNRDTPPTGRYGMVSTAHPLATEAGLKVLREGGNAFDAAVAVATTLNVVEPMMSGIGGYGTILVYSADEQRARFLNPSGRIPVNVDSDVYRPPTPNYMQNRRGAKAVSTPGNVNAWEAMWKDYGTQKWADLFDSSIHYAENGVVLNQLMAFFIQRSFDEFSDYSRSFYGKNGKPLQAGDTLVQKDLARSLRLIAERGASVVHGGLIGKSIDQTMEKAGGFLTLKDLEKNEAEWWEPVGISYRGYEVVTASPPANSWPALVRLGMMSRFDPEKISHNTVEYLHRYAEVTKHAFWTRLRWAGDPDVEPPPLDRLLSEEYWEKQAGAIDPGRATPFIPPKKFGSTEAMHTTHFVVADRWGNVVSATQTLGNLFGSKIMPEGTGIWLNNSLQYCTFEPKGNPMDAFPGRHKLSGDVPLFVMKNGKPWIAVGTPGGHTIAQNVPQIVMNMIDFDMDIQKAIEAPKISFIEPDILGIEQSFSDDIINGLESKGHKIKLLQGIGNAHGLVIHYDDEGTPVQFFGGSDPRGAGSAKGY